jgi:hypothetical protein
MMRQLDGSMRFAAQFTDDMTLWTWAFCVIPPRLDPVECDFDMI